MYRFKNSYIDNLSPEERQHLLMSAIPMLPDFKSKAGNEGQVFYVSKDIIVKKYFSNIVTSVRNFGRKVIIFQEFMRGQWFQSLTILVLIIIC